MPDLLLELFSEEIPARMQTRAADDLVRLVGDAVGKEGLEFGRVESHATPRRLVLWMEGLPAAQPDVAEERKGPRVDAPAQAIDGFLEAAGVRLEDCERRRDGKGEFYVARIERKGRRTAEVIAEIVPDVVRRFPWPKSMRWGTGELRWVRPLQSVLCLLGSEVVPFEIDGLRSGNTTRGHRFMSDDAPIAVSGFEDYGAGLEAAKVILDAETRASLIGERAEALAADSGLQLIRDEGLLREIAGLVEWPVVLMGRFDEGFLEVPPEVIVTSIKSHQKCYSLNDPRTGGLSNRFILVANIEAEDGGAKIVAGNERVIAARLSDAKFFWDQDRRVGLEERLPELEKITFHARLGTQAERVERIAGLSAELAERIGVDVERTAKAARLCKADLVSEMVGEFPELQGIMGGHYARAEGLDPDLADAIADHYRPQGPSDAVPAGRVAQAVALADKLDVLACFWAIDERPTGSKDPYALRRAALGVIRIILEEGLKLPLTAIIRPHIARLPGCHAGAGTRRKRERDEEVVAATNDLLAFLADRLKVHLRDKGARYDLIDAVFALDGQDDLAIIVGRVEALGAFLDSEDGQNLLVGFRRASNILAAEEKKCTEIAEAVDRELFATAEEGALLAALEATEGEVERSVHGEDFEAAMTALARLREPVDAFFDGVMVNVDDHAVRANRLALLARIRTAAVRVADFSRIAG